MSNEMTPDEKANFHNRMLEEATNETVKLAKHFGGYGAFIRALRDAWKKELMEEYDMSEDVAERSTNV